MWMAFPSSDYYDHSVAMGLAAGVVQNSPFLGYTRHVETAGL